MKNITGDSRLIALLQETTNEFYPLSNFYKELTNIKLTEQDFFRFDGLEETNTGLATEKYQTYLKFIYSTATPFRPGMALTFCRCLSSQNQKAFDRNVSIIFSVTCQKMAQTFLPQKKKYNEGKTRNIIYLVNEIGQFKFLDNEIKDPGWYGLYQYLSETFY